MLSDHPPYARSGTHRDVWNEVNVRKNAFPKLRFWLIDNRVLDQARLQHLQNILVLEILWGVAECPAAPCRRSPMLYSGR